ncbi:phage major capsid family protein [Streptomyces althioticus]|uniref:phage major capsid family protein n=1 Tax=Streptomyces althioticus TaxID=83380 RepID=UPI003697525D
MTTFNIATISAALTARDEAAAELDRGATGKREASLLATIRDNDAIVREAISNGAAVQSQAEVGLTFRAQTSADSSRSLGDVRVFSLPLSEARSTDWTVATETGDELLSDILSASGSGSRLLPLVRSSQFTGSRARIAVAPRITAGLNGRNDPLTALDNPVRSGLTDAFKVQAFVSADRDEVAWYPQVEEALNIALADAVGAATDAFILNGGTTTDATAEGIISGGVDTTVAALDAAALFGAVARVRNSGGEASAIVANPHEVAAILANVDGSKIDKLPPLVAIPDLADGTPVIAAGTALVADLSAVYVGIRAGLEVFYTTDEPSVHAKDAVLIGGRARIGNPKIAAAGRVQTLTVGAA